MRTFSAKKFNLPWGYRYLQFEPVTYRMVTHDFENSCCAIDNTIHMDCSEKWMNDFKNTDEW